MTRTMPLYDGIYDSTLAAEEALFVIADLLPPQMHTKLDPYVGESFGDHSPVDVICNTVESVYANRPSLVPGSNVTPGLMLVAAGVGVVIQNSNFWGGLNGRVGGIIGALRREAGETPPPGTTWPDAANDPAPADGYGPPA